MHSSVWIPSSWQRGENFFIQVEETSQIQTFDRWQPITLSPLILLVGIITDSPFPSKWSSSRTLMPNTQNWILGWLCFEVGFGFRCVLSEGKKDRLVGRDTYCRRAQLLGGGDAEMIERPCRRIEILWQGPFILRTTKLRVEQSFKVLLLKRLPSCNLLGLAHHIDQFGVGTRSIYNHDLGQVYATHNMINTWD